MRAVAVAVASLVSLFSGGAAAGPAQSQSILAVVPEGDERLLARLDPSTLRSVSGQTVSIGRQRAALGRSSFTWAFTGDGSKLAIGGRLLGGVRFVDLAEMRVLGRMSRQFEPLAWLTPRRLLAAEQGNVDTAPDTLLTVDPAARRVLARRALRGMIVRTERTRDRLVLLLGTRGRIGLARVAVADGRGRLRTVTLRRIKAGSAVDPRTHSGRAELPGLAVDPAAGRIFVAGARLVAEIDARTMKLRYHGLGQALVAMKGVSATSTRTARWLGEGFLAIAGSDSARGATRPAGLRIVDTKTWVGRVIERRATDFVWSAGSLLAYGSAREGIGLRAYARDGRLHVHVLGDERIAWVQAVDAYAYVLRSRPSEALIIDLRSGAIRTHPVGTLPLLLSPDRPAY